MEVHVGSIITYKDVYPGLEFETLVYMAFVAFRHPQITVQVFQQPGDHPSAISRDNHFIFLSTEKEYPVVFSEGVHLNCFHPSINIGENQENIVNITPYKGPWKSVSIRPAPEEKEVENVFA
jgi:hypothetical protein